MLGLPERRGRALMGKELTLNDWIGFISEVSLGLAAVVIIAMIAMRGTK